MTATLEGIITELQAHEDTDAARDKQLTDTLASVQTLTAELAAAQADDAADTAQIAAQTARITDLLAQVTALQAWKEAHSEDSTLFGMNISPGNSFTKTTTKETAAAQAARIKSTFGDLRVLKYFYKGSLPAKYAPANEGQAPVAAVCFKPNQGDLAAGKLDVAIKGYLDTVPDGHKVLLVNWQEPDDEIWKDHVFTAAQHKAATDHLCDLVHAHPTYTAGRAEAWDIWMGYSIDAGRWQDSVVSTKLDGLGWDYYWNHPEIWPTDPTVDLLKMVTVAKRIGIKQWGLFETGDNPPSAGSKITGADRAKFWTKVYDAADALGFTYLCYFNAVGTTGDHRLIPGQAWSDPTIAMLRERMTVS